MALPPPPIHPLSPSLISLMVSVDVKHHVYLSVAGSFIKVIKSHTVFAPSTASETSQEEITAKFEITYHVAIIVNLPAAASLLATL